MRGSLGQDQCPVTPRLVTRQQNWAGARQKVQHERLLELPVWEFRCGAAGRFAALQEPVGLGWGVARGAVLQGSLVLPWVLLVAPGTHVV